MTFKVINEQIEDNCKSLEGRWGKVNLNKCFPVTAKNEKR